RKDSCEADQDRQDRTIAPGRELTGKEARQATHLLFLFVGLPWPASLSLADRKQQAAHSEV
ncbi:MAG: hypothetical protein OET16_04085, partial [Chromatiales bacterium]|nr:hypothetical protein [Chromatiales bacterium]